MTDSQSIPGLVEWLNAHAAGQRMHIPTEAAAAKAIHQAAQALTTLSTRLEEVERERNGLKEQVREFTEMMLAWQETREGMNR